MPESVQLRKDHIARLRALASRRGERGISHLVEEAVEFFLVQEEGRREALEAAFRGLGADRIEEALTGSPERRV